MRKLTLVTLTSLCVALLMIGGCTSQKPVKTIENLKAAITGESTASAKYAAFAAKAREEGLDTIAKMFDATSKAETTHAANHLAALKKLGVEFTVQLEKFDVLTSKENLQAAIDGESYEFTKMYPDFIKIAKDEKAEGAVTSFTWANDTEKKHKDFYQKALDILSSTNCEKGLPIAWAVCPKCGNTFSEGNFDENCPFCMTTKDKYFSFS